MVLLTPPFKGQQGLVAGEEARKLWSQCGPVKWYIGYSLPPRTLFPSALSTGTVHSQFLLRLTGIALALVVALGDVGNSSRVWGREECDLASSACWDFTSCVRFWLPQAEPRLMPGHSLTSLPDFFFLDNTYEHLSSVLIYFFSLLLPLLILQWKIHKGRNFFFYFVH